MVISTMGRSGMGRGKGLGSLRSIMRRWCMRGSGLEISGKGMGGRYGQISLRSRGSG